MNVLKKFSRWLKIVKIKGEQQKAKHMVDKALIIIIKESFGWNKKSSPKKKKNQLKNQEGRRIKYQ